MSQYCLTTTTVIIFFGLLTNNVKRLQFEITSSAGLGLTLTYTTLNSMRLFHSLAIVTLIIV